jgi:hypothetical protein
MWNWFAGAGSIGVPYGTGGAAGCLGQHPTACNFVDITLAQFRWQAWTSLAFGSRGLWVYFYFQDPSHFHCRPFMVYPGMLASDGSRSQHYYDAQQINSAVMALGPTLLQLRSTITTYINLNDPASQAAPATPGGATCHGRALDCEAWPTFAELGAEGCPLKNVTGGAFVVGCFEHETEEGTTAAVVMNYEDKYNLFATLVFGPGRAREVSQATGAEVEIYDAAPHMPGLQVLLVPGAGKLFTVKG